MSLAFTEELIAPCEMNCGICSSYLAYSKNILKKRGAILHCAGCIPRDKRCAYIRKICINLRNDRIRFCYECYDFPCDRLRELDKRYRKNYGMSMVENLEFIRDNGIGKFLVKQEERYKCLKCGGVVCVHNGKCYDCERIESWKG
ncbi:MAG TPA: DUF3795 domain-containing protein [Dehalococcoidia bacterium]|nr:DUF3795 domain-containing protein [Dehalococcoidia bacterium]